MFEAFDVIRVINLPNRKDRRDEMQLELERAGLGSDERVEYFNAIRPSNAGKFSSIGAHGVYLSHLAILAEAAAKGASVLILEDDCDIADRAGDYKLSPDFEIFYGGYIPSHPADLQNSDIVGAHMMGFNASTVPKLLNYLRSIDVTGQHPPIDAAYVWFRRAYPNLNTVFAVPPLGNQRPSRSDIEPGAFYNKVWMLRDLVQAIRRLRRAIGARR